MRYTVWADGSGTTGGPGGIGYYARREDGVWSEGSLPLRDATNQKAEILAAAYALTELPAGSIVTLVSDSQYVVTGWNEWYPDWVERGWRKRSGGIPSNTAYWHRLAQAVKRHESVEFQWTRGHAGTPENERADVLAGEARQKAIQVSLKTTTGGPAE